MICYSHRLAVYSTLVAIVVLSSAQQVTATSIEGTKSAKNLLDDVVGTVRDVIKQIEERVRATWSQLGKANQDADHLLVAALHEVHKHKRKLEGKLAPEVRKHFKQQAQSARKLSEQEQKGASLWLGGASDDEQSDDDDEAADDLSVDSKELGQKLTVDGAQDAQQDKSKSKKVKEDERKRELLIERARNEIEAETSNTNMNENIPGSTERIKRALESIGSRTSELLKSLLLNDLQELAQLILISKVSNGSTNSGQADMISDMTLRILLRVTRYAVTAFLNMLSCFHARDLPHGLLPKTENTKNSQEVVPVTTENPGNWMLYSMID